MQHGVDHYRPVVAARKEGGAFGDEWQHCGAQVAVEGQGHLGGAEGNLVAAQTRIVNQVQHSTVILIRRRAVGV